MNPETFNRDPDVITGNRTLYDASYGEIFWKNLVAGIARGLGMFVFSILLWVVIGGLFFAYVWPMIEPLVAGFGTLTNIINNMPSFFVQ